MSKTAAMRNSHIAFIQASWHKDIVDQCRQSFTTEIGKFGYAKAQIDFFEVPGSLEIPLQAKLLAKSGNYDAIVATGFVVDGGIYRHEFVADVVLKGIMQVMMDYEVPVISAVLTPQRYHEHEEHHRFFYEHFRVKGKEAAEACAKMMENVRKLKAA